MLLRLAVFGLMALGLCGFGTVAWLASRPAAPPPAAVADAPPAPPPPEHHMILVASGPLRAGTLLKPEDLTAQDLPTPPADSQPDKPDVRAGLAGAMLRHSLPAGSPVLNADVMRPGDHGFLAAVLAPGMRATTLGVDNVSGIAGLIWPGDRVDLILTQSLEQQNLPPGRRVAAETVLGDVRVIAIDQLLARGVAPAAEPGNPNRTVTLEVTPEQAERVAVASRLGRLSLAVRAADATDNPVPPNDVRTTWGGDVSPALDRSPQTTAKEAGATVHLFLGSADGKEFRF